MASFGYDNPYNTGYGAQGGNDGGGFMQANVSSSQGGNKADYAKDTVRPVTIKQILDADEPYPEAGFQIDKTPISHVTFVGQVRNISAQTTNITYTIDDGTGTIEAKQWIDAGDTSMGDDGGSEPDPKSKPALEGYCRVWGKLKSFNNRKHVGAHVIRPVTDYNEINYHLLEATAIHLYFIRGPLTSDKGPDGAKREQGTTNDAMNASNGPAYSQPSMSGTARKIMAALRATPQSNEGLHLQVLSGQISANPSETQRAADELLSMGQIFTTVDEFTWAVLES